MTKLWIWLIVFENKNLGGRNSVVECQLPKLNVVGSNPIARFFSYLCCNKSFPIIFFILAKIGVLCNIFSEVIDTRRWFSLF